MNSLKGEMEMMKAVLSKAVKPCFCETEEKENAFKFLHGLFFEADFCVLEAQVVHFCALCGRPRRFGGTGSLFCALRGRPRRFGGTLSCGVAGRMTLDDGRPRPLRGFGEGGVSETGKGGRPRPR